MKNSILAIASILFLSSCNVADQDSMNEIPVSYEETDVYLIKEDERPADNNHLEHLKIVKTASCRFQVSHLDSITRISQNLITYLGGYIGDMQYVQNDYKKENTIQFKVPNENFDKAMYSLSNLATFVDFKNIKTQDITAQFVDVNARLATKLEVKKKYEDILRKRAKTVEELLETEDRLRILQEEIEVAQGRIRNMNNEVSLSTIEIAFYETVNYREEPEEYQVTFIDNAKNNLGSGWEIITSFILILMYFWPFLILIPLIWWVIKRRK